MAFAFVGLLYLRHHPEVSREFAWFGEVLHPPDGREQDPRADGPDPADADEIAISWQLLGSWLDVPFQFRDGTAHALDLFQQDSPLYVSQCRQLQLGDCASLFGTLQCLLV